jgi:hypothetical protein
LGPAKLLLFAEPIASLLRQINESGMRSRKRSLIWTLVVRGCLALSLSSGLRAADPAANAATFYDGDPQHLWNRLNLTLLDRVAADGRHFGIGELDILFWMNTKHLLEGSSHKRAIAVMDEFIQKKGERLMRDPLKRALLQRDLWQLFDWSAKSGRQHIHEQARIELQRRLTTIIRKIALSTEEIDALPDNYAAGEKEDAKDFPRGFNSGREWVRAGVEQSEATALAHLRSFGGRSVFEVMFRHPDGREAGNAYLKRLRSFQPIWIDATNAVSAMLREQNALTEEALAHRETQINPKVPQFPVDTQWALVRRMCVIDTEGQIRPTRLVESIQVRTYVSLPGVTNLSIASQERLVAGQRFAEFVLARSAGAPLVAVQEGQRGFPFTHFNGKGIDLFEYERNSDTSKLGVEVLKTCGQCHGPFGPGIASVNTFTRAFSEPRSMETTALMEVGPEQEAERTIHWKQRQYDWGLLQGFWRQMRN